jgi:DNA-binding response OmpR family regulator
VQKNQEVIDLTVKEFDLLVELVRNKNIALYRDRLYEKVWNEPFLGETRTLDSHIQRLRKKLGIEKEIKTVFRVGYRLEE